MRRRRRARLIDGGYGRRVRLVTYMSPGFPPALFETIGRAIGADVDFEVETSGPPPGVDPFRDGPYDLGWICSTSYVDLALRRPVPSVVLAGVGWVPDDPDVAGRPLYFGDLVVDAASPVRSLADLRGRRIGCNDAISLSGHLSLRFALDDIGESPDEFGRLVFTGGHHDSLDRLLAGDLDACVVDSIVRTSRARHDDAVASLRLVQRLGPWPVQPLVARAGLDPRQVAEIRDVVLALADDPAVADLLTESGLTGFAATDDDHYRPVHEAFRRHLHT